MTTWVKDHFSFRDADHAQKTLLRIALSLGLVGFVVVICARIASI